MASLHEIKGRIANVNATKKITRAMYLISASKSQKAKSQKNAAFPYFRQITATLADVLACSDELDTPYICYNEDKDEGKPVLYVVLAGDKGMAGGYNHNLIDLVEASADKARDQLVVAGNRGRAQLQHLGYAVLETEEFPVMNPSIYRARELGDRVIEYYLSGIYKAVRLIYTEMVTSLKQVPTLLQLLPLDTAILGELAPPTGKYRPMEYAPSARKVFDHLVPHYLKGILYSAFVEAFASEQHARMYAMDGATKSANDTIASLSIIYNRARQAKITQELTEIIGGIPEE